MNPFQFIHLIRKYIIFHSIDTFQHKIPLIISYNVNITFKGGILLSCPIYEDFFPKALIPIGANDQSLLTELKLTPAQLPELVTHWLIALEGEVIPPQNKYYHWKVSVYPSNINGSFVWDQACYTSPYLQSMDDAIEAARVLETISKDDELLSKYLLQKIS